MADQSLGQKSRGQLVREKGRLAKKDMGYGKKRGGAFLIFVQEEFIDFWALKCIVRVFISRMLLKTKHAPGMHNGF